MLVNIYKFHLLSGSSKSGAALYGKEVWEPSVTPQVGQQTLSQNLPWASWGAQQGQDVGRLWGEILGEAGQGE